jgi:gamma-glutamyltranspeptidase/glutathione hydrolase
MKELDVLHVTLPYSIMETHPDAPTAMNLRPLPLLAALLAMFTFPACRLFQPQTPTPEQQFRLPAFPPAWPYPRDTATATSSSGMVVSDAPIATHVGCEILRAGGNAVDAAVATAFALAVVYPQAGNIGGGGFMVACFANQTNAALDFREKAPGRATHNMFLDAAGNPTDRSLIGPLAAGVPGSVAGLWQAHARYGALPWEQILAPAIRLAKEGFVVDRQFASSVREDSARLARFPASRRLFLPRGHPPHPGTRWRNPDLAQVLTRISHDGPSGFYAGPTAELIVATMRREGGLITRDDLASYKAVWRTPIVCSYRGQTIVTMPPPSSGGITLALIGNILNGYDLRRDGWHTPLSLHLVAESMRRAFADRNQLLGDPDVVAIPQDSLLSLAYASHLRASIDPARATPSRLVHPFDEGTHTTHLSVVDDRGNAVALTTTINFLYGSAVTVDGAGFLLNDEMDDFATKPGTPNGFGLVQGEVNAVAPGKRMVSSMAPTIVLDEAGQPLLITGARGGPMIISAVFQVISNILDYGFPITAAVDAPRIHHQDLPDVISFERFGFPDVTLDSLKAMGYTLQPTTHIAAAPSILRSHGQWRGMADPRSGGAAEGE